jgi:hypothetical protein
MGARTLRRITTTIAASMLAACGAVAIAATPAAAANHPVSGSYAGTGAIALPGTCGGALVQTFGTATGDITPFGASTLAYDFCVPFSGPGSGGVSEITSGTAVITSAAGSVSGTLSGTVQVAETTDFPYDITMTVTSGTGDFAGATGSIALTGNFGGGASTITGTASGTVRYGPAGPEGPFNVTATPGPVSKQITLAWSPANPNGSPIVNYTGTCVAAAANPGLPTRTATTGPGKTSLVMGGLVAGKRYSCSVRATNTVGSGPNVVATPLVVTAKA